MTGSSKHQRANPSEDFCSASSLTCVRVVCRNGPDILRLPHIVGKLDGFLDSSWKWTLINACKSDSHYLVERLLERQEAEASTSCWHNREYRQWQFSQSLERAVGVGNWKIVQLLAKGFRDCHVSRSVVENAVRRGRSEIVKRLDEWGCDVNWDIEAVHSALECGHFELAKWIKERIKTSFGDEMANWVEAAAAKGNLAMVKDLLTERNANGGPRHVAEKVKLWRVVQRATNFGHLDVLKWIAEDPVCKLLIYEQYSYGDHEGNPQPKLQFLSAVGRGHSAVLAWLIHHYPGMCDGDNAYFSAAINGDLDTIHLLLSSPIEKCTSSSRAVPVAAGKGHLDIVKCLVSAGFPANYAMSPAAKNGFLDVVKWIHENTSHNCTTDSMDNAASNGHLDVVKWLHHNRKEGCTVSAMNIAATRGHLRVVQWLHENRTEGCTTMAIDNAASNGNLKMVKWLNFNRGEGCTTAAMSCAAENGHLDVVKWLHIHRSEGCTSSASDKAAGKNRLAVLKWLDVNRPEGCTTRAIHNAVMSGNLEVLQWLFSSQPELCASTAMNRMAVTRAASCSHFDTLWFLYQNGSIETLKNALTALNRLAFADWAYVHHRHEFERDFAEHLFADGREYIFY